MNELKNIVIVGKKDYTLAINFEKVGDQQPNCIFFDKNQLPVESSEAGATGLNSLYTLCIYLEKLKAKKALGQLTDVSYIVIPDTIHKDIEREIYKSWVVSGTYKDGKQVEPLRLSLWSKFVELYSEVFSYVVFKPLSKYNIKKPKYNADLVLYVSSLIKLSWDAIAQHELETLGLVLDFKELHEN